MPPPVNLKYIVLTCLKVSGSSDPNGYQGVSNETELAEFDTYEEAEAWLEERRQAGELNYNDQFKCSESHYRVVPVVRK